MIAGDLGSNSLRFVQIDCDTHERIKAYEKAVRTAKDLHKTGLICEDSIQRILSAIEEADRIFDFQNHEVHCVTTEAMRLAKNSNEVLEKIEKEYGLRFEIIDGKREAEFTLIGVTHAMKKVGVDTSSFITMDLGGGSTEISFINSEKKLIKSFPFGIVLVAEKYQSLDRIEEGIKEELKPLQEFIQENEIFTCNYKNFIATAGTPTTVSSFLLGIDYASYDYKKINGNRLHVDDFSKALAKLLALKVDEREKWVGTNRSDLVIAGILIVKEIMKILEFDECIVCDDSLREGLAISKCNREDIL